MKLNLKDTRISTRLFIGFSIIMLVVITVILVSLENSNKIIKSENLIVHTHHVLNEIEHIEASLIDLKIKKNLVKTDTLGGLDSYATGLLNVYSKVDFLNKIIVSNPAQTKRINLLKDLIDFKWKALTSDVEGDHVEERMYTQVNELLHVVSVIRSEEFRLLNVNVLRSEKAIKNTFFVHLTLFFFSAIVILVVGSLMVCSIVKPINILRNEMEIVGQGNLDDKLDVTRKDEIGALAMAFEEMLNRLKTTMASKELLKQEVAARIITEEHLLKVKTSLEKSERELIESNNAKDKFFSIVAHDLKNPFNSMLGFSNLLMEDYYLLNDEKKHYFSKIIHVNLENTYCLLENLLLWSRSQSNMIQFKPEEENLFLFFDAIIKTLQLPSELKSITIKNKIPQDILISVDKNMLSTIVRNLIGNALKFTDDGGLITVGAVKNKVGLGDDFITVFVQDSGVGIVADNLSKLFDIAHKTTTVGTANERGTGLGLVLCKEFVEKHGGTIWATSELGIGTCFYFTLQRISSFSLDV